MKCGIDSSIVGISGGKQEEPTLSDASRHSLRIGKTLEQLWEDSCWWEKLAQEEDVGGTGRGIENPAARHKNPGVDLSKRWKEASRRYRRWMGLGLARHIQRDTYSKGQTNQQVRAMATGLRDSSAEILAANEKDLAAGREKNLSAAMLDRLRLDDARLEAVAAALEHVATLPDPVGQVLESWERPNGIKIEQIRVPIGTIGIIYESRPNVTADAAPGK